MPNSTSRIIGLTGGIACGKSTVSMYLEQKYHCIILDADLYARNAVSQTSPLLQDIKSRFGSEILDHNRNLNRTKLGEIIFNDDRERQWLEQLIHPSVRQQLEQERADYLNRETESPNSSNILVMVVPLLFESKMDDLVTEIWVVSCSPSQQRQRLINRNGLTMDQANARIHSQWSLEEKVKRASVVLNNSSDRDQLYRQIDHAITQSP